MSENNLPAVPKKSGWYTVGRVVAFLMGRVIGRIDYYGAEKVRGLTGPAVLIANHKSMLDPAIMCAPITPTELTFLGKKELTKSRICSAIFSNMHMIPVDRGHSDMAAMRACVKALKEGHVLGVFPEGTRHHTGLMDELESGVAMMVLRTGVPLIPAYITPKYHFFHRTKCVYGDPIDYSDLKEQGMNTETCAALNRRITETYRRMAEEQAKR